MTREFTGWHMLAIMVTAFGIIIAVNLTLAFNAIATFPGLETRNSYVASQSFDADRAAQDALGWTVETDLTPTALTLDVTDIGGIVEPTIVSATLGRATHVNDDITPDFTWTGTGFAAPVEVGAGYWNLRLVMEAPDGTLFRRRIQLTVTE